MKIDKQKVLEILSEFEMDLSDGCYKSFIKHINALPASDDEWVSVSSPPKEDKQYNVCYKMPNGKWYVFTTGYSLSYKRFDEGSANITHYQSLPSPPTK